MNPLRWLFHKQAAAVWMFLVGVSAGYMLGRTQDPLDRAIRKAQNAAKPLLKNSLREQVDIETFNAQLQADPNKRAAYVRTVQENMVRKEKAITLLSDTRAYIDLALKQQFIDKSYQQYISTLGELQLQHGFLYQAVSNLKKALQINPYDSKTVYNLAMSYLGLYTITGGGSDKDTLAEQAVAMLKTGLILTPENEDLLYGLALIYTEQGLYTQALALCSQLLEKNPAHIDALMVAGRIYYEQEEYHKSRQIFEKAEALLLNKKNSKGRFSVTQPQQKLSNVRRNLKILRNLIGEQ